MTVVAQSGLSSHPPLKTPAQVLDYLAKQLNRLERQYADQPVASSDPRLVLRMVQMFVRAARSEVMRQNAEQESNALHRYVCTLEDQLDPQHPSELADDGARLHVLMNGKALCGFHSDIVPGEWPQGHKWVASWAEVDIRCLEGLTRCPACEVIVKEQL